MNEWQGKVYIEFEGQLDDEWQGEVYIEFEGMMSGKDTPGMGSTVRWCIPPAPSQ